MRIGLWDRELLSFRLYVLMYIGSFAKLDLHVNSFHNDYDS
jgi:hypothetical protein